MIERVGRYRILGKLGEGGMGIVYAALDETLDRQVAVKMIREVTAGTEAEERFRREARAAASVNHPNVCQLYEIGEESGALYLAMELLEGESLSSASSAARSKRPRRRRSRWRCWAHSRRCTGAVSSIGISNPRTSSSPRTG